MNKLFNRKPKELDITTENKMHDLMCMQILQNQFSFNRYVAYTASSLRAFELMMILNDILINKRQSIVEFGSGYSTMIIASLIRKNNLGVEFYAIEHDKKWIDILKSYLVDEKLTDKVRLVHAPLKESNWGNDSSQWYDQKVCDTNLPAKGIDLAIIDGPPAHEKGTHYSRYAAMPFLNGRLGENYSIYFDDCHRKAEQEIVEKWNDQFAFNFEIIDQSFALASSNKLTKYICRPV